MRRRSLSVDGRVRVAKANKHTRTYVHAHPPPLVSYSIYASMTLFLLTTHHGPAKSETVVTQTTYGGLRALHHLTAHY